MVLEISETMDSETAIKMVLQQVECVVCMDLFEVPPKILDCGHLLCISCLEMLRQVSGIFSVLFVHTFAHIKL